MKNKDAIRFQINQLRLDKIIYAIEAVAICLAALLFLSFGFSIFPIPQEVAYPLATGVLAVTLLYTLYGLVTNFLRLKKIKELEKKLKTFS